MPCAVHVTSPDDVAKAFAALEFRSFYTWPLMPVVDALAAILAGAEPFARRNDSLDTAYHRVLARDTAARRTQPPQRCRRWMVTRSRRLTRPISCPLKVIGESRRRPVRRQVAQAKRCGSLPAAWSPAALTPSIIRKTRPQTRSYTIPKRPGQAGISASRVDFTPGRRVAVGRSRLTDRDLSLAAGMNYRIAVRPPEVAVLATGDELVMRARPPPRPDRLFQRLCAAGVGARPRAPRRRSRIAADTRAHGGHPPARDAGADILITMGAPR